MNNSIAVLIKERNALKREARHQLEKMLSHRSGSVNHGWHEGQLVDTLNAHAEVCAAIEGLGYVSGHAVSADNLGDYKK